MNGKSEDPRGVDRITDRGSCTSFIINLFPFSFSFKIGTSPGQKSRPF